MTKKGTNNLDKQCPICGSIIWGKGVKVLIEGAKITVCEMCAKHGKRIQSSQRAITPRKQFFSEKKRFKKAEIDDGLEIVPDYNLRIKKVRNLLNMNQDQFAQKLNEKPSLLRRIESAKVKPNIKLATKIEKVYNIKLLKRVDNIQNSVQTDKYLKKSSGRSLGDIAFFKKKENNS